MAFQDLEKIIAFTRVSSYAALFPVLLYFPVGVILAFIRLCIFLHICLLSYILPNSFPFKRVILRVMLSVIGLPILAQGGLSKDVKKLILVANHVSSLDPFVLAVLNTCILVLENASETKQQLKPFEIIRLPSDKNKDEVLQAVNDKIKDNTDPLLFFPEKFRTNGRSSLLKFSQLPFEVDCPIQPVTIQVNRFFFDFSVSTYSSSPFEDLLWCLIFPVTLFKIRYLPITERKKDETKEEFAFRLQSNMAKCLGLSASTCSCYDATELVKHKSGIKEARSNYSKSQPDQPIARTPVLDPELEKMYQQVKDVLPDTPASSILAELTKTRDVDSTITNILEGKVNSSEDSQNNRPALISLQDASVQAKTASVRQLSFAERKEAMLESARLKYRLKYGL